MKRNLKASKEIEKTLTNVKRKKVKDSDHCYMYENGVFYNDKTKYYTYGSTAGNTPYNHVTYNGRTVDVQRLMAETFLNVNWKVNAKKQVNHKDGNYNNNNLSNLELVTRQQNIDHAINVLGKRFGRIKNNEVLEIRDSFTRYKNPIVGIKNLAKRYNVSTKVIVNVVNNLTYTNV